MAPARAARLKSLRWQHERPPLLTVRTSGEGGGSACWQDGPGVGAALTGRGALSPVRFSLNDTVPACVHRISLRRVLRSVLMPGLQQPTWLNISAVHVLQLDLESPSGGAFHAAPHVPCISLRAGPPAPEAVPLPRPAAVHVAHSPRGVLSHAPRTRSSVCDVLGHVVPQQRQERRPSAGAARGSTPHRMGTPALRATGPPPPRAWQALLRPVRGSCRTRLSRCHPLPSLQNVTLPAWAARGRVPPSVESALPATARRAASVKVSGCTCSTGAFPGATCRCGWGPGEARSSCPHTSACPLPKRPPGAPAEPLPPLSSARPVSASVHA